MNVFDISFYRRKKEIQSLEQKMAELAQRGSAKEMKTTFLEWLNKTKTGSQQ